MSAEEKTIRIGRGQGCDLILSHSSVSRRHAELTIGADGSLNLRDLESTGGTFVLRDGKEIPVVRASLRRTDRLRLGDYEVSITDLLSMIPGAAAIPPPLPVAAPIAPRPETSPVTPPRPAGDERPKTRMVRCDCGTIKERGQACPACGS
jgi:predicted component of type VI protein secretion system